MLTCQFCTHGDLFKPRPDEIEKHGPDVMGCKRLHWEGYTSKKANCEFFHPKIVKVE